MRGHWSQSEKESQCLLINITNFQILLNRVSFQEQFMERLLYGKMNRVQARTKQNSETRVQTQRLYLKLRQDSRLFKSASGLTYFYSFLLHCEDTKGDNYLKKFIILQKSFCTLHIQSIDQYFIKHLKYDTRLRKVRIQNKKPTICVSSILYCIG